MSWFTKMRWTLPVGYIVVFVSVNGRGQSFDQFILRHPDSINSAYNDFGSAISPDGRTIFFISTDRPGGIGGDDIWQSSFLAVGDTSWSAPIDDTELNSSNGDGSISITADGRTMYFGSARSTTVTGDMNIWVATSEGNHWRNLHPLPASINTTAWEAQPVISPDGKTLFFASNRSGKIGGEGKNNVDVFVSHLLADSSWSEPVDLGSKINTSGYDGTPFISSDGVTLFFSSEGHGSMGGLDIFQTKWIGPSDTDWSEPIHLPAPINSAGNDAFPVISRSDNALYFASDREGGFGLYDIWVAKDTGESAVQSSPDVQNLQLSVYPNPANSKFVVSVDLSSPATISLFLFDVLGREVRALVRNLLVNDEFTSEYDVSSIPAGSYVLWLAVDSQIKTAHVVIDR
jgi:Tol biopolymer transport system component